LRQISVTDLSPELVEVFIEDIQETAQTQNMARSIWLYSPKGIPH
jgi:hypothetical protein